MNTDFADTSFYIALMRSDDIAHNRAMMAFRRNLPIVTTECILLELGNAFARSVDHADFVELVEALRSSPKIRIVPLDTRLLDRGLARMASRPDKDWSLTACISFVVMEDEGIREALTTDKHFEQAGFVAILK